MKVTIISKSDHTGGAAVVSYRLMKALRKQGIDARMLVAEKCGRNPNVEQAASKWCEAIPFISERLDVLRSNGRNRKNLFKVDPASHGLPLNKHPLVKRADVILLEWVNQGVLSLKGVEKILRMGKPVFWAMHDMWCATGICHHAGECTRFHEHCGNCPFLGSKAGDNDLSHKTWSKKHNLFERNHIRFIAVSHWLSGKCAESSLLRNADVRVIPNPFPISDTEPILEKPEGKISIVFGAARLDDPIKGLPILIEATRILARSKHPLVKQMRLVTFGNIRDTSVMNRIAIPYKHLGYASSFADLQQIYLRRHIVVSTSHFETLPGTLVEGMAFGCVPVAFDRGGQSDIVDDGYTGFLAEYSTDLHTAAQNIADKIILAAEAQNEEMRRRMHRSVNDRFSSSVTARKYIQVFSEALKKFANQSTK